MNPSQMAQQLKHLLAAVVWPSGAGEVVFGANGVQIFAGEPTQEQIPPSFPFVLIGLGAGTPDDDDPALIAHSFQIMSCVSVLGDPLGEHAIIGGPILDIGKSASRGIGEVAARARFAIQDLTGANGAQIRAVASSLSTPVLLAGRHVAVDEWEVTALCTSEAHYTAPQELETSGTWSWAGGACSSRFDFVQYRVGYSSGATPPETPEDADAIVYTGTADSAVISAGSGRAYAVFADYSSRQTPGVIEGSSSGSVVGAFVLT